MSKKSGCPAGQKKYKGRCVPKDRSTKLDFSKIKVGDEIFGYGISNARTALKKRGLGLKQRSGGILNTKTKKWNKVYVVYNLRHPNR